jgi:hypothetical protein
MYAARADNNQKEITEKLVKIPGLSQFDVHRQPGFCDKIIGYRGINYLIEIKSKNGKLSESQKEFHGNWNGKIHVVYSFEEILTILGILIK